MVTATESMFRVRMHGRGGQGMKTAGRILGTALFHEGYEVQDAPRYGAERRGAPIFAYVRASSRPVLERGVIQHPDLVVVADDTLVQLPAAGVRAGMDAHTTLLIVSDEPADGWRRRLGLQGPIWTMPAGNADASRSAEAAGGAARLLGVVSEQALARAVEEEVGGHGQGAVERSLQAAAAGYAALSDAAGSVTASTGRDYDNDPGWVKLDLERVPLSAPTIHAAANSVQVRTGLWRSYRPVIDLDGCHRCHWMCATPCPDSAIHVDDDGHPHVDLDHCKGCMICVAQCPFHVISALPEAQAAQPQPDKGDAP